jgi:hypothetical protein
MTRQTAFVAAAAACAFLMTSCSGSNGLYPVRGTVFYKGEPASGAEVIFHPKGDNDPNALRPTATVQEDGTYTLISYPKGEGAPPGRYYVFVRWIENNLPPSMTKGKKKHMKPVPADIFKGRYQNRGDPKFFAEIKPEKNELPPFELSD